MSITPSSPDAEGSDNGSPNSELVSVPRAELEALRARVQALQPATAEALSSSAGNDSLVRQEEFRSPHAETSDCRAERRLSELERTCKAAVRDREIATVLAGRSLVSGALAQLMQLWRDEFDVFEKGSGFEVATRDGRTVTRAVTDWLESPDYAHFCLPSSRGGTGARDASRPASALAAHGTPKTLGEAIVMRWRDESAARTESLLKPIGLRRLR